MALAAVASLAIEGALYLRVRRKTHLHKDRTEELRVAAGRVGALTSKRRLDLRRGEHAILDEVFAEGPHRRSIGAMADTDADILLQGPLFAGVDRELLATVLRLGRPRSFAVLEHLIAQGEVATSLQLILRGRVRVVRHLSDGTSFPLAELGPGEGVGEIGLIEHTPRSATVVAIEPTDTLELDAAAFEALSQESPRFVELLARVLSKRLRATNELLERQMQKAASPSHVETSPSAVASAANAALVRRFRMLLAKDDHEGLALILAPGSAETGLFGAAAAGERMQRLTGGLSDVRTTIEQVIADEEWVVELTTISGVHETERLPAFPELPATGSRVAFRAVFLYRIRDGRIEELVTLADHAGLLRQLGARVMPAP